MNKGGPAVIVAVRDYIKEAERQLNNTENYRKFQEHPTALNMNLAKWYNRDIQEKKKINK